MAGTPSSIRVPPDSSGKRVAVLEVPRAPDVAQIQEVMTAYKTDVTTSIGVNVTNTSTQILPANAARRGLMLQNVSDTRIICAFGVAAVATTGAEIGFAIEPTGGAQYFVSMVDTRVLNAMHAQTGTKRLLITEWSE
jgi:hypothetical protein